MVPFIEDQKPTAFNIDYFINKFEAIPEEAWCEGEFINRSGQSCALGHCGMGVTDSKEIESTLEADVLQDLAPDIMSVNDSHFIVEVLFGDDFKQTTPKQRVLAYLKAIKEGRV